MNVQLQEKGLVRCRSRIAWRRRGIACTSPLCRCSSWTRTRRGVMSPSLVPPQTWAFPPSNTPRCSARSLTPSKSTDGAHAAHPALCTGPNPSTLQVDSDDFSAVRAHLRAVRVAAAVSRRVAHQAGARDPVQSAARDRQRAAWERHPHAADQHHRGPRGHLRALEHGQAHFAGARGSHVPRAPRAGAAAPDGEVEPLGSAAVEPALLGDPGVPRRAHCAVLCLPGVPVSDAVGAGRAGRGGVCEPGSGRSAVLVVAASLRPGRDHVGHTAHGGLEAQTTGVRSQVGQRGRGRFHSAPPRVHRKQGSAPAPVVRDGETGVLGRPPVAARAPGHLHVHCHTCCRHGRRRHRVAVLGPCSAGAGGAQGELGRGLGRLPRLLLDSRADPAVRLSLLFPGQVPHRPGDARD